MKIKYWLLLSCLVGIEICLGAGIKTNVKGIVNKQITLQPGWNLVVAPGKMPKADNEAVLADLQPIVLNRNNLVYTYATLPLPSGEAFWIFSRYSQTILLNYEDEGCVVGGLEKKKGWQLVGVGGEEAVVLDRISQVWEWNQQRWIKTEVTDEKMTLAAGHGYFIFREEGEDDGVPDAWKLAFFHTTDVNMDSDPDNDNLTNLEEYLNGTDPTIADTDADGLPDGWEVTYGLNPLDKQDASGDADADDLTNLQEYEKGTNPTIADTDGDGMPDGWEVTYGLNPLDAHDASTDADNDSLTNLREYQNGTNPTEADTDGDGMPDGWEVSNNLNPLDPTDAFVDSDNDGLTNLQEYENGTNPWSVPHTIVVVNGVADKNIALEGETITIEANEPAKGLLFDKWIGNQVEVTDMSAMTTTFIMPAKDVTVTATYIPDPNTEDKGLYVVVDLSGGPKATSYPVRYTNSEPILNKDICRTTELWLRRIPAGTFTMGSPSNEWGRYSDEKQHDVFLGGYYIGVFECTQKQWELVMGDNPAAFEGSTRPVEYVTYDMIRGNSEHAGAGWPSYGHNVDAGSFMGKLQKKTGLIFDLPTEAQWEYACRADTTTAYNSGKNMLSKPSSDSDPQDANLDEVGRNWYNMSDGKGGIKYIHTKVGSYLPNAWGLYDMHGNVYEWCLDWWFKDYDMSVTVNPTGPNTGTLRVVRGGSWGDTPRFCRSAYRSVHDPTTVTEDLYYLGFRVVLIP